MDLQNQQSCRRGLKYEDLHIGMKVRIIDISSSRYLQEGVVLSIVDDFSGGYDLRLRMETAEIIGDVNPANLDFE